MDCCHNLASEIPSIKVKEIAAMPKAIHAQEDAASAQEKTAPMVEKLQTVKLKKPAEKIAFLAVARKLLSTRGSHQPSTSLRGHLKDVQMFRLVGNEPVMKGVSDEAEHTCMSVVAAQCLPCGGRRVQWGRRRHVV